MVTTPQKPALEVTARSVSMFRKMNIPIAGLVDNMSQIICPHCGHDSSMYGNEVFEFGKDQGLNILGRIPMESDIAASSDSGAPIVISKPDSHITQKFMIIAERVENFIIESNLNKEKEAKKEAEAKPTETNLNY